MTSELRIAVSLATMSISAILASCGGDGTTSPTNGGGGGQVAASVTLPSTQVTLASLGETHVYTATATDADGAAITSGFTWTSSNPGVATVSGTTNSATATAAGNGTTQVTVARDGRSASATLVVNQVVANVAVSPSMSTLVETLTQQLNATAQDARSNAVIGRVVDWSSNDAAVASVDAAGVVTAQAVGSATITAMVDGVAGTGMITVEAVSFSNHVQPIFTADCALSGCHAGSNPAQGMNLSQGQAYANIVDVQSNESSLLRVRPSFPDESYLVHKIQGTQVSVGGSGGRMPLGGQLTQAQIDIIRAWVARGAANN